VAAFHVVIEYVTANGKSEAIRVVLVCHQYGNVPQGRIEVKIFIPF